MTAIRDGDARVTYSGRTRPEGLIDCRVAGGDRVAGTARDTIERVITVAAAAGLHARPAADFVRLASDHAGAVEVRAEGREPVDGASILGIMTLDVARGESIVVSVSGPGGEALLDSLEAILNPR